MSARRCGTCGISYPALASFAVCPVHNETTHFISTDPDEDWQATMERLLKQAARAEELRQAIPLARGIKPAEDKGLLWVGQIEMQRAGVRLSHAASRFHLFALEDGWIYETQGWDEPRRRWWIDRVAPTDESA